jgi:hypothetical protein
MFSVELGVEKRYLHSYLYPDVPSGCCYCHDCSLGGLVSERFAGSTIACLSTS